MTEHLMHCSETSFTAGTWGGAVLTGFAVRCGSCKRYFCVERNVIEMGASIYSIKSVRDLTCPYCAITAPTKPEQNYILEDHSYHGED